MCISLRWPMFLAAALAACSQEQVRLRPAAKAPRVTTAEYDQRLEMSLESVEIERDGQLQTDASANGSRLENVDKLVFEDTREGATLVRRMVAIEGTKRHIRTDEFGEHVDERVKSSPLVGMSVRFDASGAAHFVSPGCDERHLAGLVAGGALADFLTDAALEPGQRWRVNAAALGELLHPGGDLELAAAEDSADARTSQSQLRRNLSGEIEAVFWGLRELGELQLGVLQLVGEVDTHAHSGESHVDLETSQRYELRRRIDGEILWDCRAGRAHSARLECKFTLKAISRQTRRDDLTPRVIERRASYRGSSRTDARFSAQP